MGLETDTCTACGASITRLVIERVSVAESKYFVAQCLQSTEVPTGALIGSVHGLLTAEIISSDIVEGTNALSPRQSKSKKGIQLRKVALDFFGLLASGQPMPLIALLFFRSSERNGGAPRREGGTSGLRPRQAQTGRTERRAVQPGPVRKHAAA